MSELFHPIPGNPMPHNAAGGFLDAWDGRRIRYAVFTGKARPKNGTVVVLPGRNETIEKYFETARDLNRRGFGVATLDWRGQGRSDRLIADGHRGHVGSFFDYARELDLLFEEVVLPDCLGPYYVLAHSAGALVALLAAPSLVNRVRRMVLIAPFLTYTGAPLSMTAIRRIATVLHWIGLGRMYAAWGARPSGGNPFAGNALTSDEARYARNVLLGETHPMLALGGPTVDWIKAACEAVDAVNDPAFMKRIKVPVMFVGAGADTVVSTPAIADYARRLRGGAMLTIDGARHEILQEADFYREQFWAAFDAFVPGSGEVT